MSSRLQEVADRAGVSKATVSRVLNDKPGVKEANREAVLTALDVLGYDRPSGLRPRRAGLVGLVVPDLESPIFPLFSQVISLALARHGYTPVLCADGPDRTKQDEYVAMLRDRAVSGIIFISGRQADSQRDPARYRDLVAVRLPIVLVNGFLDEVDAPFVSCDDRAAGELAAEHLVSLGHRRIGLIVGDDRHAAVRRQLAGYRSAMEKAPGGRFDRGLVETSYEGVEGGYAAAIRLLPAGVTALVCGSDLLALGAIRAVRQRGLSVPGDVSVVGYDDSVLMGFTDPPLTTIRQPVLPMGNVIVRFLMDEIGRHPAPRGESLFQPELIKRSSTGPSPN